MSSGASVAERQRLPLAPAAAGVTLLVLVASAGADDGTVLCPFRRCTGGYCPGCGATRAANRFVRGDLAGSWSHHPWVILAAVQFVGLAAMTAFVAAPDRPRRLRQVAIPLLLANCALLVAIWVVRLATDAVPTGWL